MEAKDYEVVLCNDGFLYINKDDGNDAISKDSKCLSERDLEEIKSWIDKNHEYVHADAFIKKACDFFEENIEEEDCKIGSSEWTELRAEYKSLDSFMRAFVKYMKGE